MTKVLKGECNHCGKCCLRSGGVMVENPMIELSEDRCKFYVDELNDKKFGHCLIINRGNKPISSVKDGNGNKITEGQIYWFNDNCPSYPKIEDVEKGMGLLSDCSFYVEEV